MYHVQPLRRRASRPPCPKGGGRLAGSRGLLADGVLAHGDDAAGGEGRGAAASNIYVSLASHQVRVSLQARRLGESPQITRFLAISREGDWLLFSRRTQRRLWLRRGRKRCRPCRTCAPCLRQLRVQWRSQDAWPSPFPLTNRALALRLRA